MRTAITLAVAASVAAACGGGASDSELPDVLDPSPVGVHGVAPTPVGGIPSIVMLIPMDGQPSPPTGPDMDAALVVMDQLGMRFSPGVLIVPEGATIRFTNSEAVAHNVRLQRLRDGVVLLDSDTDPSGHVDVAFEQAGGYDVTCKTHPGMTAFIFATPTPFAVVAERDGAFDVPNVPPGAYTLRVWSADAGLRQNLAVSVTGSPQEVVLGEAAGASH